LDTQGDKIGIVLGLVFIAIALFGLPRSGGFGSIAVLIFLLGIGGGIVVTGANALTFAVSPDHQATASNLVNLFFGLGGLLTPFISANLFQRNWVRLCYTIAGLTMLPSIRSRCPCPLPRAARDPSSRRQVRSSVGRCYIYSDSSSSSTSPVKWECGTG
jgi:MFS family permease